MRVSGVNFTDVNQAVCKKFEIFVDPVWILNFSVVNFAVDKRR